MSSKARATGGDSVQQHRDVLAAATQAGVERVLYTSHMAANANSRFKPMHDHAATEVLLAESGLKWTSLRHGFYATSALRMIEEGLKTGVIEAPANGVVSWTAHDDLAAGAASIACAENVIDGCTPPMTGPEALDARALAKLVSLDYREVSDEAFRAKGISFGLPPMVADIFLGMHQASRHGEFAEVNPFLEQRIGRTPLTVEQLLRARSSR